MKVWIYRHTSNRALQPGEWNYAADGWQARSHSAGRVGRSTDSPIEAVVRAHYGEPSDNVVIDNQLSLGAVLIERGDGHTKAFRAPGRFSSWQPDYGDLLKSFWPAEPVLEVMDARTRELLATRTTVDDGTPEYALRGRYSWETTPAGEAHAEWLNSEGVKGVSLGDVSGEKEPSSEQPPDPATIAKEAALAYLAYEVRELEECGIAVAAGQKMYGGTRSRFRVAVCVVSQKNGVWYASYEPQVRIGKGYAAGRYTDCRLDGDAGAFKAVVIEGMQTVIDDMRKEVNVAHNSLERRRKSPQSAHEVVKALEVLIDGD